MMMQITEIVFNRYLIFYYFENLITSNENAGTYDEADSLSSLRESV